MLFGLLRRLSAMAPSRRKSLGEWCMLASALCILPLLMLYGLSTTVKILLQGLWLMILTAGFWLAKEVRKP